MSFYCTLTSSSSLHTYRNNFGGRFRSDLPRSLFLDNRWKVGLVELIYKKDWSNIRNGENKIVLEYLEEGTIIDRKIISLPVGHYYKNEQLLQYLKKVDVPGELSMKLQDNISGIIKLTYKPEEEIYQNWRIGMSISLAEIIGFTQDQEIFRDKNMSYYGRVGEEVNMDTWTLIAKRSMKLTRDLETLFIHCNIIEPQIIGSKLLPVLRITPSKGLRNETVSVNYDKPHYVNLSLCTIQSILIEIYPAYSEHPIPFESEVILKLHFKKDEGDEKVYK